MVQEDYVSFEVAKLLKEKGFDEPCIRHWDCDDNSLYGYNDIPISNSELQANEYNGFSAPSQSMAMKWLREVHNISIEPFVDFGSSDKYWWSADISYIKKDGLITTLTSYNTYEKAVEAALKYVLENLI